MRFDPRCVEAGSNTSTIALGVWEYNWTTPFLGVYKYEDLLAGLNPP
jgi:hypothetical protein